MRIAGIARIKTEDDVDTVLNAIGEALKDYRENAEYYATVKGTAAAPGVPEKIHTRNIENARKARDASKAEFDAGASKLIGALSRHLHTLAKSNKAEDRESFAEAIRSLFEE